MDSDLYQLVFDIVILIDKLERQSICRDNNIVCRYLECSYPLACIIQNLFSRPNLYLLKNQFNINLLALQLKQGNISDNSLEIVLINFINSQTIPTPISNLVLSRGVNILITGYLCYYWIEQKTQGKWKIITHAPKYRIDNEVKILRMLTKLYGFTSGQIQIIDKKPTQIKLHCDYSHRILQKLRFHCTQ